jgi:hypothetical protein
VERRKRRLPAVRIAKLAERVCANPVIYGLHDSVALTIRYVGYSRFPQQRLEQHCANKTKGNPKLRAWLAALKAAGLQPRMEIIEPTTFCGWQEAERRVIAHHRSLPTGHLLLHIEDGGVSTWNARHGRVRKAKADKRMRRKEARERRRAAQERMRQRKQELLAADPNFLGGPKVLSFRRVQGVCADQ